MKIIACKIDRLIEYDIAGVIYNLNISTTGFGYVISVFVLQTKENIVLIF